ncbi:exonuclease domain-containing protein [Georgenia ruanii]|uniref:DNA polymerase III subunit epsilon n=1 Tax=Georgenia ruanii TaxID=348442 RepID=A0A7J9UUM3_9MICO|nr:exonuclease domain-containing protein [Georgenia ruanii]MPV87444.1 DNA polymerase III subunit epsilon [Georgenia ruanii]
MSSWSAGPFLGFDTETTGVDVTTDRIVTAALVHRDAYATTVRTWIIDPGVEIPAPATAIHGITTERARAAGSPPAQALEEIAALVVEAQLEGVPVVAFNAAFDLAILDHELARHGLAPLGARLGGECAPVLDPLVLDRALDRERRGARKLVDLCALYGVAERGHLHTAEVDVVATLDLLAQMAARYPDLAAAPLTEVHAWQVAQHRRWAEDFNAWRHEQGHAGPGMGLGWPMPLAEDLAALQAPA